MQVRKATKDDIRTLVDLRIEFIKVMHPGLSQEQCAAHAAMLADYFTRHINLDFWGYFAEIDGEIASVIHLVMMERPANPRLRTGKIGMILNVYTKPQYRKRGLASLLLKEAIKDAEEFGASVLELQASDMGRHVYEQLGFEVRQSEYTPMVYRVGRQNDGLDCIS